MAVSSPFWGPTVEKTGVTPGKFALSTALHMPAPAVPATRRGGKTVKPREPIIDYMESEDEEEEEEDVEEDTGLQSPQPTPNHESLDMSYQSSTQDAAPPVVDEHIEDLEPEQVTVDKLAEYQEAQVAEIHVHNLLFDRKQQYGQIRPLNDGRVEMYLREMREHPPRKPVSCLVRSMGGMNNLHRFGVTYCHFHPSQVNSTW